MLSSVYCNIDNLFLQLVIGFPTYGRSFKVEENSFTPGSPSLGAGTAGVFTPGESGFLGYFEICQKIKNGWTEVYDDELKSPYAYSEGYNRA